VQGSGEEKDRAVRGCGIGYPAGLSQHPDGVQHSKAGEDARETSARLHSQHTLRWSVINQCGSAECICFSFLGKRNKLACGTTLLPGNLDTPKCPLSPHQAKVIAQSQHEAFELDKLNPQFIIHAKEHFIGGDLSYVCPNHTKTHYSCRLTQQSSGRATYGAHTGKRNGYLVAPVW
jgi:hypothetical protein